MNKAVSIYNQTYQKYEVPNQVGPETGKAADTWNIAL